MKNLLMLLSIFAFVSCSIFQTTDQQEDSVQKSENNVEEVYVFDDVSENESKSEEIEQLKKEIDKSTQGKDKREVDIFDEPTAKPESALQSGVKYFLQLGAFTTLSRAEQFVKEIENSVPFILSIIYNQQNTYYTVRSSAYSTKAEVERLRENLWNKNLFKDSFIITE